MMLWKIKIVTVLAFCGLVTAQRKQLYGNPEDLDLPGDINAWSNQSTSSASGITMKLANEINSVDSIEEFLKLFDKVPEHLEEDFLVKNRFDDGERSNAAIATPAHCKPELRTVSLSQEIPGSSKFYFPNCIRIPRCGGCCHHALLSCEPTAKIMKNFVVIVSKVDDAGGLNPDNKEIIALEEHTKCKCGCKIQPEHCSGKQEYVKDECTCKCSNVDEEAKCKRPNEPKIWDSTLCACRCREIGECSSGYDFDPISCRCQRRMSLGTRRTTQYDNPETSKQRLDRNNRRRQNKDDPDNR